MLHRLHTASAIGLLILTLTGCAPLKEPSGRDFHAAQVEITKQIIPQGKGRLIFYFEHHRKQIGRGGADIKINEKPVVFALGWQKVEVVYVDSGPILISVGGVASQECRLSFNLKDGDELYIRVWMRQSAVTPLGFLMDRAIDQMTGKCPGFYYLASVNGEFATSEMRAWK